MSKMTYVIEDRIAVIKLDDGKVNVMNWDFFTELNASLDRAIADQAAAVIFTSRPGVFSAGLDLKLIANQTMQESLIFQRQFRDTMLRLWMFPIPTIAAYAGHAVAGGAILSFACDLFMVQDGPYKVQINEVANKMLLPTWIMNICKSSIPPRWWKEVLLHSHIYSPQEAYEKGIIDKLAVDGQDVIALAKDCVRDMFKLDARAYGASKKVLRQKEADDAVQVFEKELVDWLTSK